jgi:hypothetical protein
VTMARLLPAPRRPKKRSLLAVCTTVLNTRKSYKNILYKEAAISTSEAKEEVIACCMHYSSKHEKKVLFLFFINYMASLLPAPPRPKKMSLVNVCTKVLSMSIYASIHEKKYAKTCELLRKSSLLVTCLPDIKMVVQKKRSKTELYCMLNQ